MADSHKVEDAGRARLGLLPPPAEPMAVARMFLADDHTVEGTSTLRFWRGGWWAWEGSRWAELEERHVRKAAYAFTEHAEYDDNGKPKPWAPNRYKVADLLDAVSAVVHLREEVHQPSWLASTARGPAREYVSCSNGLLNIFTRQLVDHTPTMFNGTAVPFDYLPTAAVPARWLAFLDELWPDDADAQRALQEFFGYVISGRTDLHKILLLVGPTRAGKGVIARVLKALVGDGNHCGPTLASLATNFGLQPLVGKPLAIVSDARLGGSNIHQVVERLLSVSGEDMLTIDRKYREHWTGTLPTRFVIISNELPRFGDASGAIANRFIVLTLAKSFLGEEDPGLTKVLLGELPGILNWALDGLTRLEDQGHFTRVSSSDDAILALQDAVSPASAFVRDECIVGAHEVPVAELYAAWKDWCDEHGHKPGSQSSFGIHLRAAHPSIKKVRPRDGEKRVHLYQGIRLSLTTAHNGWSPRPPVTTDPETPLVTPGHRDQPLSLHVEVAERARHLPRLEALADELDTGVAALEERLAALDADDPEYGRHVADLRAADAIARRRQEATG